MCAKHDTIISRIKTWNRQKTVHVRLSPVIKNESEKILKELDLNMSYAVSMFLMQVILRNIVDQKTGSI